MSPSTETEKRERIGELREQMLGTNDPFMLLAEFAYENERLREQVSALRSERVSFA